MINFLLNWLPVLGTVFLTICYLPQIRKTFVTKDVNGMSVLFWLSLNVALIFMLVNAIMIFIKFGTWGTMITEALNEALALIMLIMVLKYRKNSSYVVPQALITAEWLKQKFNEENDKRQG
ncbi:hypothetical protein KNR15_20470 [Alkalihalobacillus gibsonii]|nr:hypothetical protein [Alkalicoccobacillus gibsonii]